jgi:hypothetical protein
MALEAEIFSPKCFPSLVEDCWFVNPLFELLQAELIPKTITARIEMILRMEQRFDFGYYTVKLMILL